MIIRAGQGHPPTLDEPSDFTMFKLVVADGLAGEALQLALGSAGRVAGEHVWVDRDWLRAAAGLAGDPAWEAGLAGMLRYAEKHGWIEAGTGAVRGHIERV